MKKPVLLIISFFAFFSGFCETAKAEVAQDIEAISGLVWVLIALLAFILLFPLLKKLLNRGNVSIKVGNIELTVGQAATQLTKQVLDLEQKLLSFKCELDEATNKKVVIAPAAHKKDWTILWVTENHRNHAFEIAYLERDGVDVIKAHSTAEALKILKEESTSIDAIITGMSRKENNIANPKAGLELVKKVKNLGYPIEVYVMCSPDNIRQYYEQVKAAGAKEATSSPLELLSFLKIAGLNCPRQQKELDALKARESHE